MEDIKPKPSGLKESLPIRTAQVLAGPLLSSSEFVLHKITRGRYKPDLKEFFGPSKRNLEINIELSNLSGELTKIDKRLSKKDSFIKEDYAIWKDAKTKIEDLVGMKVTNFVFFDKTEGTHVLFAEDNDKIVPIFLPPSVNNESLWSGFFGLGQEYEKVKSESDLVSTELTIFEVLKEEGRQGIGTLRNINSITNDFELRRNAVFEREGDMFDSLRSMGAMSIGELQTVARLLTDSGISVVDGQVKIDPTLESVWIKTRLISLGEELSESQKLKIADQEINTFASEVVFFRLVQQYLLEKPGVVHKFMSSPAYLSLRKDFINSHINASGQTEEQIAAAMLSNYELVKFEGVDIESSPSQRYTKDKAEFSSSISKFLDDEGFVIPTSIEALVRSVKNQDVVKTKVAEHKKVKAIVEAEQSLIKISNEIWRHKETRKIFNWFIEHSPFDLVDDEEKATKVVRTIIVNLGLAKVPNESRFTMASYLSKVPYYPEGSEILPFDPEEAIYTHVEDSIRYVFNGSVLIEEPSNSSGYESQVARIWTEGSTIMRFLSNDPRVPENVREFISILNSEDLGTKVIERYGGIANQDPQIVNRFFKEGFDRFQTMTLHRYTTDFVRGVETNLIQLTGGSVEKINRKFLGNWKNYDFSQIPSEVLDLAIKNTLENGSHRLKILNHEITQIKTLKDRQELLEKVFGWNTYDMQFLRWEKFWNVWNTLGGAWDCICFMRKPIFNSGTFKQY